MTAKLSSWKPQHLSLWVDLVEPPAGPSGVASAVEIVEMEDQAQAARYREVSAKLSQDIASMTAFNTASSESSRRNHVVNVMHQKAQVQVGKQFLSFAFLLVYIVCFLWCALSQGFCSLFTLNNTEPSLLKGSARPSWRSIAESALSPRRMALTLAWTASSVLQLQAARCGAETRILSWPSMVPMDV